MLDKSLRELGHRKRDFSKEMSLWNPLYLQLSYAINEVRHYFENLPEKNLTIYDFGCGSKPYSVFVNNKEYIGIDIDKKNIEADIHADISNVPIDDEIADIVVSFYVLEHVEDPLKVLEEEYRVLKNDGELFMLIPMHWEEHEQPYDFFRFTRFGIRSLLRKANFNNIVIEELNTNYAILGLHLARLFNGRKLLRIFVPVINYIFSKLENRALKKAKKNNQKISNVMTFSVKAKK